MSVAALPFETGWFALPANYGVHLPGFLWNETRGALEQVRTLFGHDQFDCKEIEDTLCIMHVPQYAQQPNIGHHRALDRQAYYPEGETYTVALLKNRWVIRLPWGYWRGITRQSAQKYRVDPTTGQRTLRRDLFGFEPME